jgi:hypothetical protein
VRLRRRLRLRWLLRQVWRERWLQRRLWPRRLRRPSRLVPRLQVCRLQVVRLLHHRSVPALPAPKARASLPVSTLSSLDRTIPKSR